MSTVFPLALGSIIVIATIVLYHTYQGLFSSLVMMVLTAISAAIAWNYCEPLGWSLGKWHQEYLYFILLFGGLITLGGLAKSIMRTGRYVRLGIGVATVVFLIVVSSRAKMGPESTTGNAYGQPVALIGLFVITLLSLRAIADNCVAGDVRFPWQVERAGGAVFGFFIGMIVVGVVGHAWQMMPLPPGLLAGEYGDFYGLTSDQQRRPVEISESQWSRESRKSQIDLSVSKPAEDSWAAYNRYDEKMQLQAAPFPYADSFTLGLVKALSYGSTGSDQTFGSMHADMLLELWANRQAINSTSRQIAPGDAIVSAEWRANPEVISLSDADKTAGVLTLTVDYEARDKDGVLRFKGMQVRLVGKSGHSYWPTAINLEGIYWAGLYDDLSKLRLAEAEGELGYLRYKAYNDGNHLWGKDEQENETNIRREIRIDRQDELWFQVQMLGVKGKLEIVPTSLGVVRKLERNEKAAIELIFEVDREDEPDYVVFKRSAMKQVRIVEPEEKVSPGAQDSPTVPSG